jgi:plastocyanin
MRFRSIWLGTLLILATSMATAGHHEAGEHTGAPVIQVVTTLVGGKNVFIPSTIVVSAGKPHTLSIFNTTDKPHGFSIPDLKIMEVLPDQVEHEVKLPALEAGIYPIHCHLHPTHRTATLLAVDD